MEVSQSSGRRCVSRNGSSRILPENEDYPRRIAAAAAADKLALRTLLSLCQIRFLVTNHSKVDPADQIRTARLGGAHCGHRLLQSTDVRSERHPPSTTAIDPIAAT